MPAQGRPTRLGNGEAGRTANVAPRSSGGFGRSVTRGCVASGRRLEAARCRRWVGQGCGEARFGSAQGQSTAYPSTSAGRCSRVEPAMTSAAPPRTTHGHFRRRRPDGSAGMDGEGDGVDMQGRYPDWTGSKPSGVRWNGNVPAAGAAQPSTGGPHRFDDYGEAWPARRSRPWINPNCGSCRGTSPDRRLSAGGRGPAGRRRPAPSDRDRHRRCTVRTRAPGCCGRWRTGRRWPP